MADLQTVDRWYLAGRKLEVEDVDVSSAIRVGLANFGITERPCCRPQSSITWARGMPTAAATAPMTGSSRLLG